MLVAPGQRCFGLLRGPRGATWWAVDWVVASRAWRDDWIAEVAKERPVVEEIVNGEGQENVIEVEREIGDGETGEVEISHMEG